MNNHIIRKKDNPDLNSFFFFLMYTILEKYSTKYKFQPASDINQSKEKKSKRNLVKKLWKLEKYNLI